MIEHTIFIFLVLNRITYIPQSKDHHLFLMDKYICSDLFRLCTVIPEHMGYLYIRQHLHSHAKGLLYNQVDINILEDHLACIVHSRRMQIDRKDLNCIRSL